MMYMIVLRRRVGYAIPAHGSDAHGLGRPAEVDASKLGRKRDKMAGDGDFKSQELLPIGTNITPSLAQIRRQSTSIRLLGKLEVIDEWLEWRVKWGLRGATILGMLGLLLYIISLIQGESVFYYVGFCVCVGGSMVCIAFVYYKNFSIAIARLLLREVSVLVIIVTSTLLFAIDCFMPSSAISPLNSFGYVVLVIFFTSQDAIRKKTRGPALVLGGLFALLNLVNIYNRTFDSTEVGVVLFRYGTNYTIYKRSFKRLIFVQILLFSASGLWVLMKDKKMRLMIFSTGHVFRHELTESASEVDRCNRVTTKWGEIGMGFFGYFGLLGFILSNQNEIFRTITAPCGFLACASMILFYYTNISHTILKRLLVEPRIYIIVFLALCNLCIDIGVPSSSSSLSNGLIYFVYVLFVIFLDAVKLKSRNFILIIIFNFVVLNVFNIYGNTFSDSNKNIKLIQYNIEGEEYRIMKRSVKRSIFVQILLFSVEGLWTMLTDKKMTMMTFATDNLYRKTGTTSQHIYDQGHSKRMHNELKIRKERVLNRIASREASKSRSQSSVNEKESGT